MRVRITIEYNETKTSDEEALKARLLKEFSFTNLDKALGTEEVVESAISRKFEIVRALGEGK